jgi:hypothetical protein
VLLRAAAREIRRYLASARSLDTDLPDGVRAVLANLAVVLAGPRDPSRYRQFAQRVSAFDEDGNPDVDLVPRPRGRLAALLGQIADAIDRTHRSLVGITGIAALVVVVVWIVLHRPSLGSVLPYLH